MSARQSWMIAKLLAVSLQFAAAAEVDGPAECPDLVYASTRVKDLLVDVFVPKGAK